MALITRLYETREMAEAAADKLTREELGSGTELITAVQPPDTRAQAAAPLLDRIRQAGVPPSHADILAEHVGRGQTLLVTNPLFFQGVSASEILDRFHPVTVALPSLDYQPTEAERRAAPFSAWLGWRVLSHDPAPLSGRFGWPVLQRRQALFTSHETIASQSREAAPLSRAVKLPTLTDTPAPLSAAVKLRTLWDRAAPLSDRLKARTLLPMARDDRPEPLGLAQRDRVHVRDAAGEWRVMHADQRGGVRALGQRAVEPVEPGRAQRAMTGAGHDGVEHHDPHRQVVDRILHEAVIHPAPLRQMRVQHLAAVMVARPDPDRHRQDPPQHVGEQFVLRRQAAIGQVAGDDHHIRRRPQRRDPAKRPFRQHVRLGHAIGRHPLGADVQIGNLGNREPAHFGSFIAVCST